MSVITLGLLVSLFAAACATATPAPTDVPEPAQLPEVEPTEEPMEEPTEEPMPESMLEGDPTGQSIVFWHAMSSGANLEGVEKMVADFNATNEYGITVEQISQGSQSDLQSAMNAAIATGELPNMTQGFPNSLVLWNGLDVIAPLNDYIDDPVYGLTADELGAIFAGTYSPGTLPDGSQVGIPMHQSASVHFYNHTWAQELGFDSPPATSAEWKEQMCAAAAANDADDDPDNDGTGGYQYFPDASMVTPWVWVHGGDILTEDGTAYSLNNQAVIDAALFLKDLSDSGCIMFTPSFANPEFAARQTLAYRSSTAGQPFQEAANEAIGSTDVFGAIPWAGPDGTLAVNPHGQMVGIVGTNPDQDLATWLFLKYIISAPTQTDWVAGTGYYPSQSTTDLGTKLEDDPIYAGALELIEAYGDRSEPNLAAHGSVRGLIRDAFFAILDAADEAEIIAILDQLNADAAEAVAETS
jgi:ABC-type glycerol-3-phosphate transport system substrate-binding protein